MFVLEPTNEIQKNSILAVLREYYPHVYVKEYTNRVYKVLSIEEYEHEYALAESMCAGNLVQKTQPVCTFCKPTKTVCGHLTFTEVK